MAQSSPQLRLYLINGEGILARFFVRDNRTPETDSKEQSGGSTNIDSHDSGLNKDISIAEVRKVVFSAKKDKACGFDEIPSKVLCNESAIYFLHVLYNLCFKNGIILLYGTKV